MIIHPIFLARSLLSKPAKLLNLCWDTHNLSQEILKDFMTLLKTLPIHQHIDKYLIHLPHQYKKKLNANSLMNKR